MMKGLLCFLLASACNFSLHASVIHREIPPEDTIISRLEILNVGTAERKIIYEAPVRFEAPNWSRDGKYLLFNQDGHLYHIPVEGGTPAVLNTDFATGCNNDHGFSPDGRWLAISNGANDQNTSLIYVLPSGGGQPRMVTVQGPSYWHGWSPDGKTLAYCAEREGNFDVYTIPAKGGSEKRLTTTEGLDDGPDYSPDGKYIWFNSVRTGTMQIWRMFADGTKQTRITNDRHNNWFPHPSPDGKSVVFITYLESVPPGDHPPYKQVALRLMSTTDFKPHTLVRLFGGQGTLNVSSWSPDSQWIAFVSYEIRK